MTRVDFYVLPTASPRDLTTFACKLTEKIYKLGHKVYIHTASDDEARALDDLLWTFRDRAFIPHEQLKGSENRTNVSVHIGTTAPPETVDVLINLTSEVPQHYERAERIAELVDEREITKIRARERFKFYKDQGCNIATHQVSG